MTKMEVVAIENAIRYRRLDTYAWSCDCGHLEESRERMLVRHMRDYHADRTPLEILPEVNLVQKTEGTELAKDVKLYPGAIQTVTLPESDPDAVPNQVAGLYQWLIRYGYMANQLPDVNSGIYERLINNKKRAYEEISQGMNGNPPVSKDHIKHAISQMKAPSGKYELRLSARLDWPQGTYGDQPSCLYGSASGNYNAMRKAGVLVMQYFKNGVGTGRHWVSFPAGQKGMMVFGTYGTAHQQGSGKMDSGKGVNPTNALAAALLHKVTGLPVNGVYNQGVWLGESKPRNDEKTSYNEYAKTEGTPSGNCDKCKREIHASDSRRPGTGNTMVCMECAYNEFISSRH